MNKIQGIQILRGLAASMIVLLHCIFVVYSRMTPPDEVMARSGLALGIGVDIFFVISGFIMMMISAGRDEGPARFFVNRITRIAPNYWFYTCLLSVVGLLYPAMLRAVDVDTETFIKSLLFIPFRRDNGEIQPILGVGWTLNYEMFFYAMFAAVLWMAAWRRVLVMAAIFAVLFAMSSLGAAGTVFGGFFGNTIVFTFVSGMALYLVFERWGRPRPVFCGAALVVALAIFLPTAGAWNPPWNTRFFLWGIPAALVVYAALGLAPSNHAVARFLERLGDASYSLYLSHTFTITLLFVAWQKLGQVPPVPFILASFATSIIAGFAAHRVVEIPLTQAARWLFEGRRRRVA